MGDGRPTGPRSKDEGPRRVTSSQVVSSLLVAGLVTMAVSGLIFGPRETIWGLRVLGAYLSYALLLAMMALPVAVLGWLVVAWVLGLGRRRGGTPGEAPGSGGVVEEG